MSSVLLSRPVPMNKFSPDLLTGPEEHRASWGYRSWQKGFCHQHMDPNLHPSLDSANLQRHDSVSNTPPVFGVYTCSGRSYGPNGCPSPGQVLPAMKLLTRKRPVGVAAFWTTAIGIPKEPPSRNRSLMYLQPACIGTGKRSLWPGAEHGTPVA